MRAGSDMRGERGYLQGLWEAGIPANTSGFPVSVVVCRIRGAYDCGMQEEIGESTPAWVETSALSAPAMLGAAAGLLLGDLMHPNARRAVGVGLGALGVLALLPLVVGGVRGLVTGPRSKYGVRRSIQRIRDAGIGTPDEEAVEAELREQGLL